MALDGTSIIKCTCFGRPSFLEARLYRKYRGWDGGAGRNDSNLLACFGRRLFSEKKKKNPHRKRSRAYYCVSVVDSSQKQTQETESSLLTSLGRRLFQKQTQETELFISFFVVFHRLTVVWVSFCSLIKGTGMLCFVLINSVLFNL